MTTNDTTIKIELSDELHGTRVGCDVCGGTTEKFEAFAEAVDGHVIRACRRCIECGDPDEHLHTQIARHEARIAFLRSLIGRLQLPSFAEWQAKDEMLQAQWLCDTDGISLEEALQQVRAERAKWRAELNAAAASRGHDLPF